MKTLSAKKIATTALFAALIFAVTGFLPPIRVPGTSGYVHLGDTMIYAAAYLLGGPLAAIAAAVGSALADLLVGATIYIPATAVIKGLLALVAAQIMKRDGRITYFLATALGGAIMVALYALYELMLFDVAYAVGAIPFNCIQWTVSSILSLGVYTVIHRIRGAVGDLAAQ